MVRWLRAVVDWIFRRRSFPIQLSLQSPNQHGASPRGRRGPDLPNGRYDFDSRVREPLWHDPTGRSASAAVPEPDDAESVVAIGGPNSGRFVDNRRPSDEG